ncbi:unnamed protein product [Blepharisma stoltei]|uniref:DNA/RNA-binding protein Alba-like domain-containing protein n=1 Tax=Blepharisma stoltei TaxID=1481888 RepID=A0AAU9JQB0_9CILI|nr:unnamed protein product [Blepharisma stoltei]
MATSKDEITVSSNQGLSKHVTEVATLLSEKREAKITAINLAIPQALNLVELIKHRVKGLYQLNSFERVPNSNKTRVTFLLSLDPLDSRKEGYQPPIAESEVQEKSLEELKQAPPRQERKPQEGTATSRPRGSRGGRRGSRSGGRQPRGGSRGERPETTKRAPQEGRRKVEDSEERKERSPRRNEWQSKRPEGKESTKREETSGKDEGYQSREGGRPQGRRPRGRGNFGGNRPPRTQNPDFKPRTRRAPEMEKYTRALRNPAESTKAPNEVLINARAHPNIFIREALLLFRQENLRTIIIKASGSALPKAVKVVEEIKRYEAGLHQLNKLSKRSVKDVFTPKEPGLDEVVKERDIDGFEITLTKDAPDVKNTGYQAPLPASEVREISIEEIQKL